MSRNWEAEFNELSQHERAAFSRREELLLEIRSYFAKSGLPPEKLLNDFYDADEKHKLAVSATRAMIEDYNNSQ